MLAVAIAVSAAICLGAASEAKAITQYFSGVCGSCDRWHSGWNYYYYNEAFNNWNNQAPQLRVMEHQPSGSWVNSYQGLGEIDICHARIYVEPGCSNLFAGSYSFTCYYGIVNC